MYEIPSFYQITDFIVEARYHAT